MIKHLKPKSKKELRAIRRAAIWDVIKHLNLMDGPALVLMVLMIAFSVLGVLECIYAEKTVHTITGIVRIVAGVIGVYSMLCIEARYR